MVFFHRWNVNSEDFFTFSRSPWGRTLSSKRWGAHLEALEQGIHIHGHIFVVIFTVHPYFWNESDGFFKSSSLNSIHWCFWIHCINDEILTTSEDYDGIFGTYLPQWSLRKTVPRDPPRKGKRSHPRNGVRATGWWRWFIIVIILIIIVIVMFLSMKRWVLFFLPWKCSTLDILLHEIPSTCWTLKHFVPGWSHLGARISCRCVDPWFKQAIFLQVPKRKQRYFKL